MCLTAHSEHCQFVCRDDAVRAARRLLDEGPQSLADTDHQAIVEFAATTPGLTFLSNLHDMAVEAIEATRAALHHPSNVGREDEIVNELKTHIDVEIALDRLLIASIRARGSGRLTSAASN